MTSEADGDYKWICHLVDHFSKYHIIFPLLRKEASEIAANLVCRVFSYFGLPYILHSDQGKEFVNEIIRSVVNSWPGKCRLVNGKPRSPWVQGLVERTNACIELMIAAKRIDSNENTWSLWLPEIQCKYFFVIVAASLCHQRR